MREPLTDKATIAEMESQRRRLSTSGQWKSRPGAMVSDNETMDRGTPQTGSGVNGLSSTQQWRGFFRNNTSVAPDPIEAVANTVPLDGGGQTLLTESAPEKPAGFGFGASASPTKFGSADEYMNAVLTGATDYHASNNLPLPLSPRIFGSPTASTVPAIGTAQSGDKILSRYGTGSVSSANDYRKRLRGQARSSGFMTTGFI